MVLRNLLEAVGSIEVDRLQEHRINRTPSLSRSRALILDFRDLAISRDAVREREGGYAVLSYSSLRLAASFELTHVAIAKPVCRPNSMCM